MADEAYCIGGAQSKDSYLRMDRIIEIAKRSGAQAIHPGYGFLSENAKFVDMVEAEGIVFIGPSSGPMNAMGDKINSKKIAKDAGCFTIPGFQGEVMDEAHAVTIANEVGYPVMIKASAGGGGKGMRVAYTDTEVVEGFRLSKAEALSSFGDDRMLIERFIEDPHHIEIQVLADEFGNVVAFPERECSVQRRNQKVVEESPSCLLTPATRKAMQMQAIALCKATGYRSAGTVEMLADGKQNFFFLEMNTRLQVEHPITELVSGEDLVEHMLWIAGKHKLPDRLTKSPCLNASGWAIESRVYAEDPLRNFLPSIGPLVTYKEPLALLKDGDEEDVQDGTVRIDTGVFEGANISMYYDPMIAKLCTHAKTRKEAVQLMEDALDSYVVQGVGNNICFLRSVYRNQSFRDGKYGTKFIPEQYPNGFTGVKLNKTEVRDLVASALVMHQTRADQSSYNNYEYQSGLPEDLVAIVGDVDSPLKDRAVFNVKLEIDEYMRLYLTPVAYASTGEASTSTGLGKTEEVTIANYDWPVESPVGVFHLVTVKPKTQADKDKALKAKARKPVTIQRGGVRFEEDVPTDMDEDTVTTRRIVQYEGRGGGEGGYIIRMVGSQQEVLIRTVREHELSQHMRPREVKDFSKFLLCPMPGTLISLDVKEGQQVEVGQQLAVVEAMKMQNVLRAPKAGVIKSVFSSSGSHLKVDQKILEFADASA